MVALDLYFHKLSSQTGAQEFVIVRDDATLRESFCRRGSESLDPTLSSTYSQQHKAKKTRQEFEPEEQDELPPSQPQRVESQDDLYTASFGKRYNRHAIASGTKHSGDRLAALFGQGIAESIASKHSSASDLSSGFAAPKFPIRKGSHDDLSTLESNRRRLAKSMGQSDSNEKLDLINFFDEVTGVLSGFSKPRQKLKRMNSDEAGLSPKMISAKHARWMARPSLQSLSQE